MIGRLRGYGKHNLNSIYSKSTKNIGLTQEKVY
jgi:hypothetical protein